MSKPLFPQIQGLLHGGDYNPDQWLDRPDILKEDIRLMKEAGINSATLGVFSWSAYEPREGEYHFEWLQDVMDSLYENGIYTILATPSGARPAWLDRKYPDAMRVDAYGQRNRHGNRHNHCMTSKNYRQMVSKMDTMLAERFSHHPGLLLWHISNEFGGYCYCDACKEKFQDYLRRKFDNDIQKLNSAWWTGFWSHRYSDFEEVEPPYENGEGSVLGLKLEWQRFTTWNTNDFMEAEIQALKAVNPDIPCTTNFMTLYEELDYHHMRDALDMISWDSYPRFHNDYESLQDTFLENAFNHALFRSMKPDRPFMLMESAPGLVNWNNVNKYRRPGIHRLVCFQAVASGSDTVQYFQIRKGRGASEQHHGALIDHMGTNDTRIFREVSEVGELLKKASQVAGSTSQNQAALIFDWDNRWAIKDANALARDTKNYEKTCMDLWKRLMRMGVDADIISSDDDFGRYRMLILPMLYVTHEGLGEKLKAFVQQGGVVVATYFTGYVDQNLLCHLGGFPGDGLSEVFGIISEEIDSFYPTDRNHILWKKDAEAALCDDSCTAEQADRISEVIDYAEFLRVLDAEILATYLEDYIKDTAAVTCKTYGQGKAYYLACRLQPEAMDPLLKKALADAGIAVPDIPKGVEYHVRYDEIYRYEFYLNMTEQPIELKGLYGENLFTGQPIQGDYCLDKYQVLIHRLTKNEK